MVVAGVHLTIIELKLACRGDRDLREAIQQEIDRFESEADQEWIRIFGSTSLPEDELIGLRSILSSTLRGLAISIAAGSEKADQMVICEELISLFSWRLNESRRKAQA